MNAQAIVPLLKETFSEWSEDKAPRLAAALSYYTIFALAPLLIIIIAIAGLAFGQKAAEGQIVGQLQGLLGEQGAKGIQDMIQGASKPSSGILATIIGFATLLLGASGLFGQLQDSLNTIWEVQPKPNQGILAILKQRFFSFTMVLGTGFLLLVSLILSAALSSVNTFFAGVLPGGDIVWQVVNFVVGLALVTLLFALMYKIIPDVEIAWNDVWLGAFITALLFTIGRIALGYYIGSGSVGSSYGAAGSLVILLVWIYYSAQILFMGAEFTQVYANKYGSHVRPSENAVAVTEEARAKQGMPRKEDVAAAAKQDDQPEAARQAPPKEAGPVLTTAAAFVAGLFVGRRKQR